MLWQNYRRWETTIWRSRPNTEPRATTVLLTSGRSWLSYYVRKLRPAALRESEREADFFRCKYCWSNFSALRVNTPSEQGYFSRPPEKDEKWTADMQRKINLLCVWMCGRERGSSSSSFLSSLRPNRNPPIPSLRLQFPSLHCSPTYYLSMVASQHTMAIVHNCMPGTVLTMNQGWRQLDFNLSARLSFSLFLLRFVRFVSVAP